MKYLFMKSEEDTKKSRMEYLFDVFNIYTLSKEDENFIILEGFPFNYIDVFFIIGHEKLVYEYLKKNFEYIEERNIVIITCNPGLFKKFMGKGKNIFVSKNKYGITQTYEGEKWGFEFDISDSELDFYNSKNTNIMQKLRTSMIDIEQI